MNEQPRACARGNHPAAIILYMNEPIARNPLIPDVRLSQLLATKRLDGVAPDLRKPHARFDARCAGLDSPSQLIDVGAAARHEADLGEPLFRPRSPKSTPAASGDRFDRLLGVFGGEPLDDLAVLDLEAMDAVLHRQRLAGLAHLPLLVERRVHVVAAGSKVLGLDP